MDKKIAIIGFFAYNTDYNGGQENKTRALAELLIEKYGKENIYTVDTLNWKKKPIKLLIKTIKTIRKSNNVIMLPARNGVKVFSKLLLLFKKKNTKLFYSVIGGWLPTITISNNSLKSNLIKFDGIWVETKSMKKELNIQGFTNVTIIPNFKKIKPIDEKEINDYYDVPLKTCTFSRVLKEKGIEDAINVVKKINNAQNKVVLELDIYGKIDKNYEETFLKLSKSFPDYIKYKGVVPYDDTVKVLKNYFLLLFPTHYSTEGIPGTIIDAYASGVPILSAKWNSYDDVIIDNVTGISFKQLNINDFENKLNDILKDTKKITKMKKDCLREFNKYTEDYAYNIIKNQLI